MSALSDSNSKVESAFLSTFLLSVHPPVFIKKPANIMSAGSVYVMKLIIAPQNSLCNKNYAIFLYCGIVSNHPMHVILPLQKK